MTPQRTAKDAGTWVVEAGLAGMSEQELLRGFCERLHAAGIPIARVLVGIDTLHPLYEGRIFRWYRDRPELNQPSEYGRTSEDADAEERWQRSPFYHLMQSGTSLLRRNMVRGDPADFLVLEELRAEGITDYMAMVHRFAADGVIGGMDSVYSSWGSDTPEGFGEEEAAALCALVPSLALGIKCASLARIAETLVETYLGRDAGLRVLKGRIARGVADRIEAVLWFSDLRGFTRITDTAQPDEVIPLLNDYAEAVITAVHEAGGDVLKLIGDGTLAIFKAEDPGQACRCALEAEALARQRVAELNQRRAAAELPTTLPYLGLHIGEVFYGNIGSPDRLDFTVVGPTVNLVSRLEAFAKSTGNLAVCSREVAALLPLAATHALGTFALKGVPDEQMIFSLRGSGEHP
jgi:adenylate cyclase